MPFDLNKFSKECAYCFNNTANDVVSMCNCNVSVCSKHFELHSIKNGCTSYFKIKENEEESADVGTNEKSYTVNIEEKVLLSSYFNSVLLMPDLTDAELIEALVSFIKTKELSPDDSVYCSHIKQTPLEFTKPRKCDSCNIKSRLWHCIGCDYCGCGREQYGVEGKSHMLKHSNTARENGDIIISHAQAISVDKPSSIYCYLCNGFISNPPPVKFVVRRSATGILLGLTDNDEMEIIESERRNKEENARKEDEMLNSMANAVGLGSHTEIVDKKDILTDTGRVGIQNYGNSCYISAALQLLGEFYDVDLTMHFELCESSPTECLACQFVKIITLLQKHRIGDAPGVSGTVDKNLNSGSVDNISAKVDEISGKIDSINVRPPVGLSISINKFLTLLFREFGAYFEEGVQADSSEFLQILLERLKMYEECGLLTNYVYKLKHKILLTYECPCGAQGSFEENGSILLMDTCPKISSGVEHMFDCVIGCPKCGDDAEAYATEVKLPDELIISLKRYQISNNVAVKKLEKITEEKEITIHGSTYRLKGCITHKGTTINSGHYIFYDASDDIVINDEIIRRKKDDDVEQGFVFYYSKINKN